MKRYIKYSAFIVFVFHILMLALYFTPNNPLKSAYKALPESYINFLWRQSWKLFSPAPPTSTRTMLIKCNSDSSKNINWLDLSANSIQKTFEQPFSVYPKLRYIQREVGNQLVMKLRQLQISVCPMIENNVKSTESTNCLKKYIDKTKKSLTKTREYKVAVKYSKTVCAKDLDKHSILKRIDFRYVTTFSYPFSKREEYKKGKPYKVEYLEIPSYILKEGV